MLNNMIDYIKPMVNCSDLKNSKPLVIGMLLSDVNKSCISMAKPLGISHDVLQKIYDSAPKSITELNQFLIKLAQDNSTVDKKGYLIIDDTALAKIYAKILEGVGLVWDSIVNEEVDGYKLVVLCWTNQIVTIPLAFKLWNKKLKSIDKSHTKLVLAQDLIREYKDIIPFDSVLLDGLFASEDMMQFFEAEGIIYYMRLPKNRVVKHEKKAPGFQIGNSHYYRLNRNQRRAQKIGYFGSIWRYITLEKLKNKAGDYFTRFIVSNKEESAQKTIDTYGIRWKIEKIFRTSKQLLGINNYLGRTILKQSLHFLTCFAAYTILEIIKKYMKFDKTEDAYRHLQIVKNDFLIFA